MNQSLVNEFDLIYFNLTYFEFMCTSQILIGLIRIWLNIKWECIRVLGKLSHTIVAIIVLMCVTVFFDCEVPEAKGEKSVLAKVLNCIYFRSNER